MEGCRVVNRGQTVPYPTWSMIQETLARAASVRYADAEWGNATTICG